MNFDLLNDYNTESGSVIRIKEHPILNGVVISLNIKDDGTADVVQLESNEIFDMNKQMPILQEWINLFLEKIIAYHKLTNI